MSGLKDGSGVEPLVNLRQLRKFVLYPLSAAAVLGLLYLWLPPAFVGFSISRGRADAMAPLREKARDLDISYAEALSVSGGGKAPPVVWCVQNRGALEVLVDGDPGKPLFVSNYPAMPLYSGSKHQACTPMLLLLEERAPGRPVTVFFKDAPEVP